MTKLVLPILLRLALMLGTLAAMQLTYNTYSPEMFLALNMLSFLVGLHTALSYSVQVQIWETGHVRRHNLVSALVIAVAIVLGAALVLQTSIPFLLGGLLYVLYRFSDRLSFNALITQGKVAAAYGVSIAAITVETIVFYLLATHVPENVARLIIPSLIAGAIPATVFFVLLGRSTKGHARPTSSALGHELAFAAHSLAILCVVMVDRIAPKLNPVLGYLDARYLLLFA